MFGGILEGLMRQESEIGRLARLEEKLQSARLQGADHCVKCGFCCHRRTCVPSPEELKSIAEFLKMDITDLINKYFSVDTLDFDIYFLKPVGINTIEYAGRMIPDYETFNEGPCIFLDEKSLCKIHPVRPKSAKVANCWLEEDPDYDHMEGWKDDQLLKQFGIDGQAMRNELSDW